jgi:hypothetical protein
VKQPKKGIVFGFILLTVLVTLGFVLSDFLPRKKINVNAASRSAKVDLEAEWEQGSLQNIDSVSSPGDISINNKSLPKIDLMTIYNNNNNSITTYNNGTSTVGGKQNVVDGDIDSIWGFNTGGNPGPDITGWWKIDMGQSEQVVKYRVNTKSSGPGNYYLYSSTDDVSYAEISHWVSDALWHEFAVSENIRYIKLLRAPASWLDSVYIHELEAYAPITATHTTADTQLDGTANFFEWEHFTPTQTVPANTTISYKFRSSPDHNTWTGWTGAQIYSGTPLNLSSLVTSRTTVGDVTTFYRYLQVETTLTSTDGVSTPTLSDYTIDYHTNVKPNKPTAQTAVIGG